MTPEVFVARDALLARLWYPGSRVALKSKLGDEDKGAKIGDELDALEKLLERTKILYEQYFMGIQKMPPSQLHRTVERKILELTQIQIRNTGLRFRLNTLTQKFGVYNTYWRRTNRQIEQGTYLRDIVKVKRRAEVTGEEIPEEILAKMPKRMRDDILRGRGVAARKAERAAGAAGATGDDSQQVRKPRSNVHTLDEASLDDLDLDALFGQITRDEPAPAPAKPAAAPAEPAAAPAKPAAAPAKPAAAPAKPAAAPPPVPRRPAPSPVPKAAPGPRRAAPSSSAPPGMTDAQVRDLHTRYNQARKLVGEKGEVSYDRLMRTLSTQAPRIMQQHKAAGVEFNVVIKDDKVVLKAKPKK